MEYCPPGEEGTAFFHAAYLTRLPADIRSHLDGVETGNLKDLAARADRQWANVGGTAAMMANVNKQEEEEDMEEGMVAAATKPSGRKWPPKKREQTAGPNGAAGQNKDGKRGWDKMVQLTLCRRHMKFGDAAYSCADPSSCQFKRMGN